MKQIDIIIPAYHAQDVIENALATIYIQSLAKQATITIVNDADGIGYSKQIARFADVLDIQEITLKTNGGPGVARQAGIDATNSPYLLFLDADDTLYNPFALEMLLLSLNKYPESALAIGDFVEIVYDPELHFYTHKQDFIWMFGKLYRRDFLEQYKIRFNLTRANEDNGFNTIVQLCMIDSKESAITVEDIVYTWNFNPNSITRKNDYEYTYNQNVTGYTENMIYAINHAKQFFPNSPKIALKVIEVMINLYVLYIKTIEFKPQMEEQNWQHCVDFYKQEFKEIERMVEPVSLKRQIIENLKSKSGMITDLIPKYTFNQFLERLKRS